MPKDADHPGWRIHPAPDGRGAPARPRRLRAVLGWTAVAVALIAVNVLIASRMSAAPPRVAIPYAPDFIGQVRAGNVAEVVFRGEAIDGTFRSPVAVPAADPSADPASDFTTRTPPGAGDPALVPLLLAEDVAISARDDAGGGTSTWLAFLLGAGPIVLVLGAMALLMRRAGRGPSGAAGASPTGTMGMGRARARRYEATGQHVTFADVAGIDEAKAELTQIVGFLKDPGRYRALGARLPRGVLLTGPPGTGKTLLARAIAGEAGVPFFSMSASEFIEMIVGVGASRVRDLFAQAKAAAPAIVFIDELDAVGRSRTAAASLGGGSDEREQTLNQILTEMDGFEPSTGVIVLGATNRPDILDSALLRAGRFDRRVAVQPPDRDGRLAILNVHVRGVPLAPDTDLAAVAARTPGMVGADLAGLVNEAALLAADRGHRDVGPGDVDDALEKIVLGGERRIVMSRAERERTAYHEAGHALVGMLSPLADPVRKISIIPRGTSLGVTYAAPDADRYSYTREDLRTRIRVALGGRAAEELVYGEISTGAEADIDQLTDIARRMAGRWGMSDAIGPVALIPPESRAALVGLGDASARARHLLDAEVRRIIDDGHREAVALLTANRDRLESLTRALLAAETLDRAAAYAAAGLGPPPDVAAVPGPAPVTA